MSDTVRAPKCPYLSSMGMKDIQCALHARFRDKREFENAGELRKYVDSICYKDFDCCETYKAAYAEEMASTEKYILDYRECAFCCNNSGYTGLKDQNGSTHGFCQVKQEVVPKFDTGSVCEWFNRLKREEVREVPKQKYWTKCGREFQKNSIAVVTGYEIDINDPECADCPFQVDVKEGWPQVHKKWECRAGSQPPNHTTEWTGSLENKNTLSIHSLDNQLMEKIKEFCENHPNLGASYNADHMADCRRTLAVNCSSNKKGMAAKKELIEKFFPNKLCSDCFYREKAPVGEDHPMQWMCWNADHRDGCDFHFDDNNDACSNFKQKESEEPFEDTACCENCNWSEDWGESVEYIKCAESGKRKDVRKKQAACHNYVPVDASECELDGDPEEQLEELLNDGVQKEQIYIYRGLV